MARSAVAASLAWPGRGRRLLFMATAVIRPNVVKPRILKELDKKYSYLNVAIGLNANEKLLML